MANHQGSEGTVHIGTDAIAEIKSYSVNESMNVIDDSNIGDTAKTFKSGSTFRLNNARNDDDVASYARTASSITAIEIGA